MDHSLLDAALDRIVAELERTSYADGDYRTWLGLTVRGSRNEATPLDVGLYDGLAGIVLFLRYAERVWDDRTAVMADESSALLDRVMDRNSDWSVFGMFDGRGGVAYVRYLIAALNEDVPAMSREVAVVCSLIDSMLRDDNASHDVVGGLAGLLILASSLATRWPSRDLERRIDSLIEALSRRAEPMSEGVGWPDGESRFPMGGFAHGVSGVAYAAVKSLPFTSNSADALALIQGALAYEESLFEAPENNWRDLRAAYTPVMSHGLAWCHGAPGIGLTLLASRELAGDDSETRLKAALHATLSGVSVVSDSLCHGVLGNAEFVRLAQSHLTGEGATALAGRSGDAVDRYVEKALVRIAHGDWRCGTPGYVSTPGLMRGLAGIGYGLLRLIDGHSVPNVLLLDV